MSTCRGAKAKRGAAEPIKIASNEELQDHANEVRALIAKRAYEIYASRNCGDGRDLEDWRQAESEVLCNVAVGLMESSDSLTIHTGVPGFAPEDLQISIEPHRLTVSGKRKMTSEEAAEAPAPGLLHLFRVVNLPEEVIPRVQSARLSNGLLELILPKAAQAQSRSKAA